MDLRQSAANACVFVILAVSFFQVVAELEESKIRSNDEKLNRIRRQEAEPDTFNYVGLWISIGIFLAFDGMIVVFGVYKSYFGEIHMPVKREDRAPKVQNEKATPKKEEDGETTAVNPAFVDDEAKHATTQTDFPDDGEKENGAVSSTEHEYIVDCTNKSPVIYTV